MKKMFLWLIVIAVLTFIILFMYDYLLQRQSITVSENEKIQETLDDEEQEVNLPKEDIHINMSVIGDIMCHNSQYKDAYNSALGSYDFSYVFTDIKEYVESADIAIGNLETTFAGKQKGYSNYPRFNTPEQLAKNLKDFGIDVLATANNHCLDTNYEGLVSTINYLDEAGINHVGTNTTPQEQNKILIKDVNGIKIAFLAFTYGTNGIPIPKNKEYCVNLIDEDLILEQLNLAKQEEPDLICVNMHWGIEYQTKQNSEQEKLADLLFKNGVDIILGSHPHVLQPMEKKTITLEDGTTKECFVIYSLGNFMSGQTKANTKNSVILNIEICKSGETEDVALEKVEYVPIYMYRASNGSTQRYKVLDIEKLISNYEAGIDTSIGASMYSTLKNELGKIKSTMGESIEF